jgi:hypothetical protein
MKPEIVFKISTIIIHFAKLCRFFAILHQHDKIGSIFAAFQLGGKNTSFGRLIRVKGIDDNFKHFLGGKLQTL